LRSERAIFFMGSIRDRIVWRHHSSRNLPAQAGELYFPELLKGFLEKVGMDGLEVVVEEIAQAEVLVSAEILAAAEQQPTGFPEDRGAALAFHPAGFLGTDVVQCLVHIGDGRS
jgi:hypothetical protein